MIIIKKRGPFERGQRQYFRGISREGTERPLLFRLVDNINNHGCPAPARRDVRQHLKARDERDRRRANVKERQCVQIHDSRILRRRRGWDSLLFLRF